MTLLRMLDIREDLEEYFSMNEEVLNDANKYSDGFVSECIGANKALEWVLRMINISIISSEER